MLKTIFAIVNDVIGAERLDFGGLCSAAYCRDDRAAKGFGQGDGRCPNARSTCVNEHCFTALQLRIVKKHMLNGRKSYGRAGGMN